jgi:hypothetical protein
MFDDNNMYGIYNDNEINKYNEEYNKINNYITNILKKEVSNNYLTTLENLKIGDIIYISFIPQSQRDIYALHPKFGSVIEIINDYVKIKNLDNEEEELLHEPVSIFSLGYSYDIYIF